MTRYLSFTILFCQMPHRWGQPHYPTGQFTPSSPTYVKCLSLNMSAYNWPEWRHCPRPEYSGGLWPFVHREQKMDHSSATTHTNHTTMSGGHINDSSVSAASGRWWRQRQGRPHGASQTYHVTCLRWPDDGTVTSYRHNQEEGDGEGGREGEREKEGERERGGREREREPMSHKHIPTNRKGPNDPPPPSQRISHQGEGNSPSPYQPWSQI